jgi:hypothetical protein
MNGKSQTKSILNPSLDLSFVNVLKVLLWMGVGAFALFLHIRLKSPIRMPGHHGIEFMSILILLRLSSNYRWATTISSVGMGTFLLLPIISFNDPLLGINYLIPGILIDVLYNTLSLSKSQFIKAAFFAGLAYISIPISKLLFAIISGIPSTTFIKNGFILPFISFFMFGSMGGLLGAILQKPIRNLKL